MNLIFLGYICGKPREKIVKVAYPKRIMKEEAVRQVVIRAEFAI